MSCSDVIAKVEEAVKNQILSVPKSDTAVIIVPDYQLLIPMHNGIVQCHHATVNSDLPRDAKEPPSLSSAVAVRSLRLIVCGFLPRAQQTTDVFGENDRKLDPARVAALDAALRKLCNLTGPDLLGDPYVGTPPSRI
ncbi:hypothetical protein EON64_18180, partial [archaeon]